MLPAKFILDWCIDHLGSRSFSSIQRIVLLDIKIASGILSWSKCVSKTDFLTLWTQIKISKTVVLFAPAGMASEALCNDTLFFQDEVGHTYSILNHTTLTHVMNITQKKWQLELET